MYKKNAALMPHVDRPIAELANGKEIFPCYATLLPQTRIRCGPLVIYQRRFRRRRECAEGLPRGYRAASARPLKPRKSLLIERATGLEPATSSLGSWHSTN